MMEADTESTMPRRRTLPRLAALAGTVLVVAGLLPAAGVATPATPELSSTSLLAVGPTSGDNGFPVWYRDTNGLRTSLCLDPADPMCGFAAGDIPDPTQPASFPDNFPEEAFYMQATAQIALPGGGSADLVNALEAAFSVGDPAPGDQITFGRVRIRVDAPNPGHYTVTHPYGVDEFDVTAGGTRSINFTEDIGIGAPGDFTGALSSRIDPFLTWDTGLVEGPHGQYLGDPAVEHAVTGSPFDTNVFRVEGPDVGGPGVDVVETALFTLQGKVATNAGVRPGRTTYNRAGASGGTIDVLASSLPTQAVQVSVPGGLPTTLRGDANGHYFARIPFTGDPPQTVRLVNVGDDPPATFDVPVTDHVTITDMRYDSDENTLSVSASSSDLANPPTLTAEGFGPLGAGGTATFTDVLVPPDPLTVTSPAGGAASESVRIDGAAFAPDPVTAVAGPDLSVQQGQQVILDGTASRNATALSWQQVSGTPVPLANADTGVASFTAPVLAGTLVFQLTAQGPAGPSTDEVTVTVEEVAAPVADAGPDQTVLQGDPVHLDGGASTGTSNFGWTQLSGTPVTLTGANTATPSFTMPRTGTPLVFRLTVSGPGGSAAAEVTVTPVPDNLTVTRAEFRGDQGEWRVEGTASVVQTNTVTVWLGSTPGGTRLGTATVDTTGAWSLRLRDSDITPGGATALTVESSRGGSVTVPLVTRNIAVLTAPD